MKAGLFDEYRLAIAPTVVGSGRRLFGRGAAPQQLALVETRPLATGGVILRYRPTEADGFAGARPPAAPPDDSGGASVAARR